ncbi:PTS sugar transporter subunit IIC [Streptococcus gordonii]|uniref:PTS sugar transporter subunit IIC n=1 Tax=Streptococcus gordonii TaxID=1302 RepID=UPI001CBD580E|nr:PTS transporter subunit EIIC [Streptococcus gordonii]MBZ2133348.1 PTS transporter subunit EIIC [Streptococcus gordonii]MBZ2141885.1 PTS transporter subunit EIIC [Streptococcus gordonii]MBZ2143025.1 PTS transporter subunit EIIC [Streptococcus gordonii]MBZ2145528.1 PTS transporter subunit EIIC [Streptococcus gordonii]
MIKQLEKFLVPLAEAIGKNKYLVSIRDGFLITTPILIAGSIFLLIGEFPWPALNEWMGSIIVDQKTGANLTSFIEKPAGATFSIMAIFAVIAIAYSFAKQMKTNKIFGSATAVMSWLLLMPYSIDGVTKIGGKELPVSLEGIPLNWVGAKGIFVGIIVSFLAVHIYAFIEKKGWVIKMPPGVPPTVVESFAALIPAMFVMIFFFLINLILGFLGTNAFQVVFDILQTPLVHLGGTLGALLIAFLFNGLFWFFGINGGAVVGAVYGPVLATLSLENVEFFKNGVGSPNIVNEQFYELFVVYGGAGSTLSLIIAMLFFCKSKRITELGKLALIPGIFGINEPIIFGLPMVLNPVMVLPFLLIPIFNILVGYTSMAMKLVPITNGVTIPWTTPPVISGFLATDWRGAVLQIILIIIGIFLYMPFIKAMDKQYLADEANAVEVASNDEIDLDNLSFDDL